MNRRIFIAAIGAVPLLTGCFWDKHFDLTWEEEVQLHDGRVIVVKLKRTYERLHSEFGRYTSAISRDTQITFDAGGTAGRVTQLVKGGKPLLLDQKNGNWYLVLSVAPYRNSQLLPGQDWGIDQNGNGQHVATLQGTSFKPVSMCVLPDKFQQPNLLVDYTGAVGLSKFDGKLMTLADKAEYLNRYPLLPGAVRLERPHPRSSIACKSENQLTQGDQK